MGRKHSSSSGSTRRRPQTSKQERHRLTNQEMTDLLARYETANQRDHEGAWR